MKKLIYLSLAVGALIVSGLIIWSGNQKVSGQLGMLVTDYQLVATSTSSTGLTTASLATTTQFYLATSTDVYKMQFPCNDVNTVAVDVMATASTSAGRLSWWWESSPTRGASEWYPIEEKFYPATPTSTVSMSAASSTFSWTPGTTATSTKHFIKQELWGDTCRMVMTRGAANGTGNMGLWMRFVTYTTPQ